MMEIDLEFLVRAQTKVDARYRKQNQNENRSSVQGGRSGGSPGDDRSTIVAMRMQGGAMHFAIAEKGTAGVRGADWRLHLLRSEIHVSSGLSDTSRWSYWPLFTALSTF